MSQQQTNEPRTDRIEREVIVTGGDAPRSGIGVALTAFVVIVLGLLVVWLVAMSGVFDGSGDSDSVIPEDIDVDVNQNPGGDGGAGQGDTGGQ